MGNIISLFYKFPNNLNPIIAHITAILKRLSRNYTHKIAVFVDEQNYLSSIEQNFDFRTRKIGIYLSRRSNFVGNQKHFENEIYLYDEFEQEFQLQ